MTILSCLIYWIITFGVFVKKIQFIIPIIEKSNPQAVVLSETWFTEDYQPSFPNFIAHHTIRSNRQYGGVSVFISSRYFSRKISELSYANSQIEICTVEVIVNSEKTYIIGIYRPHSGTIEGFTGELEGILHNLSLGSKRCCISGDMNINMINENSANKHYVDALQSHHFSLQ